MPGGHVVLTGPIAGVVQVPGLGPVDVTPPALEVDSLEQAVAVADAIAAARAAALPPAGTGSTSSDDGEVEPVTPVRPACLEQQPADEPTPDTTTEA